MDLIERRKTEPFDGLSAAEPFITLRRDAARLF
jgi:hypothetical protein